MESTSSPDMDFIKEEFPSSSVLFESSSSCVEQQRDAVKIEFMNVKAEPGYNTDHVAIEAVDSLGSDPLAANDLPSYDATNCSSTTGPSRNCDVKWKEKLDCRTKSVQKQGLTIKQKLEAKVPSKQIIDKFNLKTSTFNNIRRDAQHYKQFASGNKKPSRVCASCKTLLVSGDPHPHCKAHVPCFANKRFDPRKCTPCNKIFASARKGNFDSVTLWRYRLKLMKKSARQSNNSTDIQVPEAADYYIPRTTLVDTSAASSLLPVPAHHTPPQRRSFSRSRSRSPLTRRSLTPTPPLLPPSPAPNRQVVHHPNAAPAPLSLADVSQYMNSFMQPFKQELADIKAELHSRQRSPSSSSSETSSLVTLDSSDECSQTPEPEPFRRCRRMVARGQARKQVALLTIISLLLMKKKLLLQKEKPAYWSKPLFLRRNTRGSFRCIFNELAFENVVDFQNYTGMSCVAFHSLLKKISPYIIKEDTIMRESISPGARLEATLHFLSSGCTYTDLQYSTRISKQSLSSIIPETCEAIYRVLKDDYMQMPTDKAAWLAVADGFENKWNFPHCLGAIDGKHISICPPKDNRSNYFNYKGTHSIVLMAVVNANYEFLYIDIGTNGRVLDGSVWSNCSLASKLQNGTINLPRAQVLPESNKKLPFVFVGDDALPLKKFLMKPYPFRYQTDKQRIFSYRLSRARRTVENAFGILAHKFRIFLRTINLEPSKVEKIVLACTAMHNFLRREHADDYIPPGSIDNENIADGSLARGIWRNEATLVPLEGMGRNPTEQAKDIRTLFTEYFNNEGSVPWQRHMCGLPQVSEH